MFLRYKFTDDSEEYTYDLGICTDVDPSKDLGKYAAVVQHSIVGDKQTHVIGCYNNTQLITGSMLYNNNYIYFHKRFWRFFYLNCLEIKGKKNQAFT